MTDRRIRAAADLDGIAFDVGGGVVPLIAQDVASGHVLMQGWADRSALDATLHTGQLHFWSRSRATLWRKGETSGNTLALHSLYADCDGDALLALVSPAGPTCHTGERTCFGDGAVPSDRGLSRAPGSAGSSDLSGATGVLERLDATLAARAAQRPAGSYTARLLGDANLRLKKLGEENAELVAALASHDRPRAVAEAADLVYHVLVALRAEGATAADVLGELAKREQPGKP